MVLAEVLGGPAQAGVVGSLPYSNQWIYDDRQSYLYLALNQGQLAQTGISVNQFQSDFGSKSFLFPSIDYFGKLFALAGQESGSQLRNFNFWGRYGLGFQAIDGHLIDPGTSLDNPAEHSSFLSLTMKVGPFFSYDGVSWVQPYIGIEIEPFAYRLSSTTEGAEANGAGALWGPAVGVHLPLFFDHHGSLFGEARRDFILSDSGGVYAPGIAADVGMGLVF